VAPPRADLDDIFKPERHEHMARVLDAARFDGCFFADTLGLPDIDKGSFDTYLRYGGSALRRPAFLPRPDDRATGDGAGDAASGVGCHALDDPQRPK
jgi:hypothetical protein